MVTPQGRQMALEPQIDDPLRGAAFLSATTSREIAPRFWVDVPLDRPRTDVVSARLTATAHGIYEARIDGSLVSDHVLQPGWTSYEWRLPYQVHDVTSQVAAGEGSLRIELLLGNGWFRGDLGFLSAQANYGEDIAVGAVLEVGYGDGSTQRVATSTDWSADESEIRRNSLYGGQTIDARVRSGGRPLAVRAVDVDRATLVRQVGPPVTRHEVLRPTEIWTSPSGRTLVDFGQNLVGWIRFSTSGPAGSEIVIRHAEVLEDGELGTRPLRGADATDVFVLSGGKDEFEPTFTFHGFRYAEVEGWPGELTPDSLDAVVVHSQMRRTGHFSCSEPLVNQLVQNSVWGQKGNFLERPHGLPPARRAARLDR